MASSFSNFIWSKLYALSFNIVLMSSNNMLRGFPLPLFSSIRPSITSFPRLSLLKIFIINLKNYGYSILTCIDLYWSLKNFWEQIVMKRTSHGGQAGQTSDKTILVMRLVWKLCFFLSRVDLTWAPTFWAIFLYFSLCLILLLAVY